MNPFFCNDDNIGRRLNSEHLWPICVLCSEMQDGDKKAGGEVGVVGHGFSLIEMMFHRSL